MMASESQKLAQLEVELKKRVVGQEQALTAIANAVRRSRAGIAEDNRPIGSFIFLGPTGVGKTETAKALAEFLFNDQKALVRVDMSEYMEKHSVSKMIGSPPGYVGYEEGGQLTEVIRRRPYAVVLFDEIEKTPPHFFNILLQVLDDGRVTDAKGRGVNFKNTIIIMTSNLGGDVIKELTLGFSDGERTGQVNHEAMEERINSILQHSFRPEFLNRVDDIITFHALSRTDIKKIVELQLANVSARLKQKGITLTFSAKVKDYLALKGYDDRYGARPLKRLIQNQVLDPLALMIIEGKIAGGKPVAIDVSKDIITIK